MLLVTLGLEEGKPLLDSLTVPLCVAAREDVKKTEVLGHSLAAGDGVRLALTQEIGVLVPLAEKLPLSVEPHEWLALSE